MGIYSIFQLREGLKMTSGFATLGGIIVGAVYVYNFCYLVYERTKKEKESQQQNQKSSSGSSSTPSPAAAPAKASKVL